MVEFSGKRHRLPVAFLDLIAGGGPDWSMPELLRTGRVRELADRIDAEGALPTDRERPVVQNRGRISSRGSPESKNLRGRTGGGIAKVVGCGSRI